MYSLCIAPDNCVVLGEAQPDKTIVECIDALPQAVVNIGSVYPDATLDWVTCGVRFDMDTGAPV